MATLIGVIVTLAVPSGGSPSGREAASTRNSAAHKGSARPGSAQHARIHRGSAQKGAAVKHHGPPSAVEAGLLPWSLPSPLSRMVVLPNSGGLVLAGGLNADQTSSSAVSLLNPITGSFHPAGSLPSGVHDAAGAVIGGSDWVFGGGAATVVPSVERVVPSASGTFTAGPSTALPAPRADLSSATIGATTYIVGGYDGTHASPAVLATKDGRTFTTAATLRVPVRYPAVATLRGDIYLFGGLGVLPDSSSTASAAPVDVIQRIDPATHKATIVGHLPYPLAGASAATLRGTIYLAGGTSTKAPPAQPGVGTTQLNGFATASTSATPGEAPVADIWAFNAASGKLARAGTLQVPVAYAGIAVTQDTAWLVGGETASSMVGTVQSLRPNPAFGLAGAPGAGSPYYGYKLLIADRGNDRLLLMDPQMRVDWSYPNSTSPPDPLGFYFPDDAFFVKHGTAIISNQEENETIVEIAYPSGKIDWSYGHPKVPGTDPGYLHEPDDAYLLKNGQITVADAENCRVLVINPGGTVASQIGTNGACIHNPPTSMGSPNGDTPLWDGNLLVSEINGSWVSEYTPAGKLVWTVHLPISYPSDPQQVGASATANTDHYLIADYASPGQILEFTREGTILADYNVTTGPGTLNHPSLVEDLPSGMYMVNDDYNHR
ncbi:MAG: hypothetical protein J2P58_02090, partial [Acidimicrobiaceae bacterium]|nr:hypothetical protein [Acidimicrobiaceae bacterium]